MTGNNSIWVVGTSSMAPIKLTTLLKRVICVVNTDENPRQIRDIEDHKNDLRKGVEKDVYD